MLQLTNWKGSFGKVPFEGIKFQCLEFGRILISKFQFSKDKNNFFAKFLFLIN